MENIFWKEILTETICYNMRLKASIIHIRISENEEDVMQFGWIKDDETLEKQDFDFDTTLTVR